MTQEEKELITKCITGGVECAVDCVYETLSLLFEEISKHPELNLQQTLLAISIGLKTLADKKEKEEDE